MIRYSQEWLTQGWPWRRVVGTAEERRVHKGSDFNPTPGSRIRLKLDCGHVTRFFAASRAPRSRCLCGACPRYRNLR